MKGPLPRPCDSCPYRLDVPSGIWHPDEYAKLPRYDADTPDQPPGVFLCHQGNGHVCAGWAGCHDTHNLLSLRVARAQRVLSDDELQATLTYVSPVPLWPSGAEAAAHGLAETENPGPAARRTVDHLLARNPALWSE